MRFSAAKVNVAVVRSAISVRTTKRGRKRESRDATLGLSAEPAPRLRGGSEEAHGIGLVHNREDRRARLGRRVLPAERRAGKGLEPRLVLGVARGRLKLEVQVRA